MISKMSLSVLVHINTGTDNAEFTGNDLAIENLEEFLKYIKMSGYPEAENTSIEYRDVKTNFGAVIPSVVLKAYDGTYHIPLGRPTLYNKDYDWLIPTPPDKDPSKLVAECKLGAEDFSRIYDNIKLMGRPPIFGLHIENGEINLYIKGPINQQFRKQLDPTKTVVYDNFTTNIEGEDSEFRLFSTTFIENMVEFGADFDLSIRYYAEHNAMLLKGYATIHIDGKSPINIVVGTQESDSDSSEGSFEVLF